LEFIADSLPSTSNAVDGNGNQRGNNSRQRQRRGGGNKKSNSENNANAQAVHQQSNDASNNDSTQPVVTTENSKKKKRRKPRSKRNKPEARPWLSALPPGQEDPITLEPLEDLPYPPFVLVVGEPYIPVYPGMWPPPPLEETDKMVEANKSDLVKDREVSILQQQWGDGVLRSRENSATVTKTGTKPTSHDSNSSLQGRLFHFFDGSALAYYFTSSLEFINPYDRRDLTRAELAALDEYMAVHKLGNAGVVQAYGELSFWS
jgi:hypothetical protein